MRTPVPLDDEIATVSRLQRLREIRAIGIAALHEGPGSLNLWTYLAELKNLKVRGHKVAWREARIALLVAMKERPAQVVGGLNTLRGLCQKKNLEGRFEKFEAMVMQSLGETQLTNHSYRAENFSQMSHDPIWSRVSAHLGALGEAGYEAFLNSGTLLGVVRDKRLIDNDDDIDLAVILNATNCADAVIEWLALHDRLRADGLLDEEATTNPSIIKLLPVGAIQIDLFPAWFEEDQMYVYPHTYGELSRSDVLPLQACSVTGNAIPADPEKMLALNYGDGWRAPDPYFKFPWTAAKKRFHEFLSGVLQ